MVIAFEIANESATAPLTAVGLCNLDLLAEWKFGRANKNSKTIRVRLGGAI